MTDRRPLGGWCSGPPGARPKCNGCKWPLCQHECHDKKPATTRKDAA